MVQSLSGARVELGQGQDRGTAKVRYAPSPSNCYDETTYRWVERWSAYAEALGLMRKAKMEGWADAALFDSLGEDGLLLHTEVVESRRPDPRTRGQWVAERLKKAVDETFGRLDAFDPPLRPHEREAVAAWHCYISYRDHAARFLRWKAEPIPEDPGEAARQRDNTMRLMQGRAWTGGLEKGDAFPPAAAEGLRKLTEAIDSAFSLHFRRELALPASDLEGLHRLLPHAPGFVEKLEENVPRLKEHVKLVGKNYETGIDGHGRTELLRRTIEVLGRRIAQQKSMLVLGPTSSGKSHVSMIAAAHAVQLGPGSTCIVLLPTKALVNQVVADWEKLKKGTEYENWEVLPGSRDYPQYDEPLRRGRFKIAVMIPEKLLGLMANGMRLDNCRLIVADELQTIIDEQRGLKLQRLLSGIRKNHPSLPVMGISASLHSETKDRIVEWLDVDEEGLIEAKHRPVPLTVSAFDAFKMVTRPVGAQAAPVRKLHSLQAQVDIWQDTKFIKNNHQWTSILNDYGPAVSHAINLILPAPAGGAGEQAAQAANDRRVLFFARSRDDAENLAAFASLIVKGEMAKRGRMVTPHTDPYRGFFTSDITKEEELEGRSRDYLRLPLNAGRDDLGDALRTGVGYHNARLEPAIRSLMEDGFRHGSIRLLFATETLKLGINLPADVVIVGTVATPESATSQRLMTIDSAIQKMGRAGRLGMGTSGESYLLVPERGRVREDVRIDERTQKGLSSQVPANKGEDERSRALRAVSDLEAAFNYYLSTTDWLTQGAHYEPRYGETLEWVAEHLLQERTVRDMSHTRDELLSQAQDLYRSTLDFQFTGLSVDAESILTRLSDARLIGPSIVDPGRLQLTGLGRAVSVNGLPIHDAPMTEQIAQALEEGAGSLTLLWLAVSSRFIRDANSWIQVRRSGQDELSQKGLEQKILRLSRDIGARPDAILGLTDDVIGRGTAADELREILVEGNVPARYRTRGFDVHTDLLRASLLVPWSQGTPFEHIRKEIVQGKLTVNVVNRNRAEERTIIVHEADLRSLAENAAYLLSAASDLLTIRPSGNAYRRLQTLARAVEVGLPPQLHELARLNLPATHRERLAYLVPRLGEKADDPTDILKVHLVDPSPLANPSYEERQERAARYITDVDFQEIDAQLALQRSKNADAQHVLSKDARTSTSPAGGTFGRLLDDVEMFLAMGYAAGAQGLLTAHLTALGMSVQETDGGFTATSRRDPGLTVRFSFETDRVGFARLEEAEGAWDVLVSTAGISPGAAAEPPLSGTSPTVVEPAALLELLAGVLDKVGRDLRVSDQGEGAAYVEVGHAFLDLLKHNQPVMTGKDIFSRILGLVVAEPPALQPQRIAARETELALD